MEVGQPDISVTVKSQYIEEQSNIELQRYVFTYTITIHNHSQETVQLISRRWLMTDANDHQMTVEGDGVIGQQPFISAGSEYTYSSATVLETPVGVMQGHYMMQDPHGRTFMTLISPFRLAVPHLLN